MLLRPLRALLAQPALCTLTLAMPNLPKGLRQTYDLQDFAYHAAMAMKDSLTKEGKMTVERDDAMAITALIRAHDTCRDRTRIDRGRPLPGSFRPETKRKGRPLMAKILSARDLTTFAAEVVPPSPQPESTPTTVNAEAS